MSSLKDPILGIDISNKKFDVALLRDNKIKNKHFTNDVAGFNELLTWLHNNKIDHLHACMESTSTYGEPLAEFLFDNQFKVSIVNPARIKGFARSELLRTKTDKSDASLIARFCAAMSPEDWTPLPVNLRELRDLTRRLDAVIEMQQQENNRLHSATAATKEQIEAHINYLEQQKKEIKNKIKEYINNDPDLKLKKDLLDSIPGIGEKTIGVILSEFADISRFKSPKHLASFLGIAPKHFQSGHSVRGRSCMSKVGNSSLRKAFFMPAMVALKHNPVFIDFKDRLLKAGKSKMLIVGAAMRKLIHIIYGVLKNNEPFDPSWTKKILDA
jgi:transposase